MLSNEGALGPAAGGQGGRGVAGGERGLGQQQLGLGGI